jgi:predicted glycosyltransferase
MIILAAAGFDIARNRLWMNRPTGHDHRLLVSVVRGSGARGLEAMSLSLIASLGDMTRRPGEARVLIYSHDTFGLGHIRRCRAIANALVADHPKISVIIVSGSSVISSFQFGTGVDYVRIPGVEKQPDGTYTAHHLNTDLNETIRLRQDLIRQLATTFDPDVVIADKEPIGLKGEFLPALEIFRRRGARVVLGVRDVLDDPAKLRAEWRASGADTALAEYYDDILVYGLEDVYQPLQGLPDEGRFRHKISYTGYLKRAVPSPVPPSRYPRITREPFILVTPGGGGDGAALIDWVISAYESQPSVPIPALIVFGPFLSREKRKLFSERIARQPKLDSLGFDPRLELLTNRAHCVIAMGGYNTFCEILSFDKPALIVPRSRPRLEQTIRARNAKRLGLADVLESPDLPEGEGRDPAVMAGAIDALLNRPPPSHACVPRLLEGLSNINLILKASLFAPQRHRRTGEARGDGQPTASGQDFAV